MSSPTDTGPAGLHFDCPPLFPVARAPQPHCSRPTRRHRAPAQAPETAASSAKEAAKRLSPTRRAECRPTWTSVSFTPCGAVTTVTGRAPRRVWDPSEDPSGSRVPVGRKETDCMSTEETPGLRDKSRVAAMDEGKTSLRGWSQCKEVYWK